MTSFIRCVAEKLGFILCLGSAYWSISHVIDMDGDHVIGSQCLWPPLNNCFGESTKGSGGAVVRRRAPNMSLWPDVVPMTSLIIPSGTLLWSYFVQRACTTLHPITLFERCFKDWFQYLQKKVKRMAVYIINTFREDKLGIKSRLFIVFPSMIKFTLTSFDLELWKEAVNVWPATLGFHYEQTVLLRSLQVFGFEKVRFSFERILDIAPFDGLYTFLREIPFNLAIDDDVDAINLWCDKRLRLGLRRFGVDSHVNVPHLIDMAHDHGIHYLLEIRRSEHSDVPLLFAGQLIRTLQRRKSDILASKANVHFDTVRATAILEGQGCKLSVLSSKHAIDILVDRWLNEAIGDLLARLRKKTGCLDHYVGETESSDCLLWVETHKHLIADCFGSIKLCIIAGHVERCGTILDAIEGLDGQPTKLSIVFFFHLGPVLQAMHTDISSPPFAPFLRRLIERCVRCFLGTRTRNPQEMFLRQQINKRSLCACKTCTEVKEFLHQLYVPQRCFSGSEAVLRHIKCNTVTIHKLANIKLVDRPRIALQIIKNQNIFAMQRWENRVKGLQEILCCIGPEHIIERAMGDRYADLKVAMEGKGEYRDSL
ncbi:hypothetical protein M378DRAFT_572153 [Amanita muscaria Koide BX008]|uniref:Uncharacterized protein n=1 Tax=Amanita muscaria (strain Koide BX008) TaxID=946122 RepID=A0A0C2WSN6_AMAMK|nr:hypothetical protein M378DRAFT_572153 [Amanita muscaria Koide BX008]